jgi:hypothetical protein
LRIDHKKGYVPTAKDAWRVTCFFISRWHRRRGFAEFAVKESVDAMKKLGVRGVEAFLWKANSPPRSSGQELPISSRGRAFIGLDPWGEEVRFTP